MMGVRKKVWDLAVLFLIAVSVGLLLLGLGLMGAIDSFLSGGRCRPYWDEADERDGCALQAGSSGNGKERSRVK